jgi:hypothetical protein
LSADVSISHNDSQSLDLRLEQPMNWVHSPSWRRIRSAFPFKSRKGAYLRLRREFSLAAQCCSPITVEFLTYLERRIMASHDSELQRLYQEYLAEA